MEETMKALGIIFAIMMTLLMSSQVSAQNVKLNSPDRSVGEYYTRGAIDRAHELYPLLDKEFKGNLTEAEFNTILETVRKYYGETTNARTGKKKSGYNGYEYIVKNGSSRVSLYLYLAPFTVLLERTRVLPLVYPHYSYAMGLLLYDEKNDDELTAITISPETLTTLLSTLGNEDSMKFGEYLAKNMDLSFFLQPKEESNNEDLSFFLVR
jgi:hypothetical protein